MRRVLQAVVSLKVMGWDPGQRLKWQIHEECIPFLSPSLFSPFLCVWKNSCCHNSTRLPSLLQASSVHSDRFEGLRCKDEEPHFQTCQTWKLTARSILLTSTVIYDKYTASSWHMNQWGNTFSRECSQVWCLLLFEVLQHINAVGWSFKRISKAWRCILTHCCFLTYLQPCRPFFSLTIMPSQYVFERR